MCYTVRSFSPALYSPPLRRLSRSYTRIYAHKVLEKHPEMSCLSRPPVSGPVCIDETKGAAAETSRERIVLAIINEK